MTPYLSPGASRSVEGMETRLVREIHPEIRIIDAKSGVVEFVASDETLDSYKEVISAKGWRFDRFRKNAPLVDSHDYYSVDRLLGKVTEFEVRGGKLIERAKFAIEVEENTLARLAWRMVEAGYLRAVSVGFFSVRSAARWDVDRRNFEDACQECGASPDSVDLIHLEQQQIELSLCIIGANPNAVARGYKAGVVRDEDLDFLETLSRAVGASEHTGPHANDLAQARLLDHRREREAQWLREFAKTIGGL